jgi:hypothetical protein
LQNRCKRQLQTGANAVFSTSGLASFKKGKAGGLAPPEPVSASVSTPKSKMAHPFRTCIAGRKNMQPETMIFAGWIGLFSVRQVSLATSNNIS